MRLWHKDLIPVLPRQQLLGQWRECCMIAKNIKEHGWPNHMLVNKIMDYPIGDFYQYGTLISAEMLHRGYKCDFQKFAQNFDQNILDGFNFDARLLYPYWHNHRYLKQCFFNLQEKFDCGGIPSDEWQKICRYMKGVDSK